jgi:2-amino-4-hydroxy-6-hydroxymethyldihydropteridine diphosphokinase
VTKAFLGLGSNLGDREATLGSARQAIQVAFPGARFSPQYETEPVGGVEQPWFLNQVAEVETYLPPLGLLEWCLVLEKQHGRLRDVPQGPRTLDVDVLLYGDLIHQDESLSVPHPRMLGRRFVLLPLSDLSPELMIPGTTQTVLEALKGLQNPSVVRPFSGRSMTC